MIILIFNKVEIEANGQCEHFSLSLCQICKKVEDLTDIINKLEYMSHKIIYPKIQYDIWTKWILIILVNFNMYMYLYIFLIRYTHTHKSVKSYTPKSNMVATKHKWLFKFKF